jgi:hypothetical protein
MGFRPRQERHRRTGTYMILKLTLEELRLLTTLASDQLFRKEFIDPRIPGHRPNSGEISLGKSLVARLRLMVDQSSPKKKSVGRGTGWRLEQHSNGPAPSASGSGGSEPD